MDGDLHWGFQGGEHAVLPGKGRAVPAGDTASVLNDGDDFVMRFKEGNENCEAEAACAGNDDSQSFL